MIRQVQRARIIFVRLVPQADSILRFVGLIHLGEVPSRLQEA
jgi:hypothetical protein